jgi:hypothetical protein
LNLQNVAPPIFITPTLTLFHTKTNLVMHFSVCFLLSLLIPSAGAFTFARPVTCKSLLDSLTELDAKKVFIDGEAGTTGIQVRDRLADREDLEIISIPDDLRKDEATRKQFIFRVDNDWTYGFPGTSLTHKIRIDK